MIEKDREIDLAEEWRQDRHLYYSFHGDSTFLVGGESQVASSCGSKDKHGSRCKSSPRCDECRAKARESHRARKRVTEEQVDWCGSNSFRGTCCKTTPKCKRCARVTAEWAMQNRAADLCYGAKARARERGLAYDLDQAEIQRRVDVGFCERSGVPFDTARELKKKSRSPLSPSLDRIDPNKGYTMDNVQVVCLAYNQLKGTWGDAMCLMIAEGIVRTAKMKEYGDD